MKTCIPYSVASRIDRHVCAWRMCQVTQCDCVRSVAVDLGVSEDRALDLLNCHESAQSVFDALGTEVCDVPDVDMSGYRYTEEDLSGPCRGEVNWWYTSLMVAFVSFLTLAIYFLSRAEL